mmetsp:Transcript_46744/g.93059  ORF Transcript_46744/g.93059 Transcript_46744/m.93059 type:complete len:295 (-) Transcript_46744:41-925(-)
MSMSMPPSASPTFVSMATRDDKSTLFKSSRLSNNLVIMGGACDMRTLWRKQSGVGTWKADLILFGALVMKSSKDWTHLFNAEMGPPSPRSVPFRSFSLLSGPSMPRKSVAFFMLSVSILETSSGDCNVPAICVSIVGNFANLFAEFSRPDIADSMPSFKSPMGFVTFPAKSFNISKSFVTSSAKDFNLFTTAEPYHVAQETMAPPPGAKLAGLAMASSSTFLNDSKAPIIAFRIWSGPFLAISVISSSLVTKVSTFPMPASAAFCFNSFAIFLTASAGLAIVSEYSLWCRFFLN